MAEIVVLGSLNIDLVARVPRFPAAGETLTGSDFKTVPGGKGANQAVAAARLGASAAMVGRIGDDVFGGALIEGMRKDGVDADHVLVTPGAPTGTALITVDDRAENSIVIIPGANGNLSPADVDTWAGVIRGAKVLMLQLEVPLETVLRAAETAKKAGVTVMLDPAPARELPVELLRQVDIITPNETEASILTGRTVSDARTAKLAAVDLLRTGVGAVLVKLGARGALVAAGNTFEHVDGFSVQAVDTTAAGDAFGGALATALVEGKSLQEAVVFANAAGALATTRFGAQTSMPSRQEVEEFLRRQ
ncbi:MAG: ribokinase [Firmicutes bacterium]|nr:ribokinase [Bacillota bacterium]